MKKGLPALFLLLTISGAFAQGTQCGEAPIVANEDIKGNLLGRANLLRSYLGRAELVGQVEAAKRDIFAQYFRQGEDRAVAYFQYVLCGILFADRSLTTQEKVDQWVRVREILGNPERHRQSQTPSTRPSAGPNYQNQQLHGPGANIIGNQNSVTVR